MVTVILFILTLLLVFIAVQKRKRTNFPPGPFPWPLIGNRYCLQTMIQKFGGDHYAYLELCKRYKSSIISLRLSCNDTIVVSDIKHIQEILKKEEYEGRPWNEFVKLRNLGLKKGITMNDGEEWKELRSWTMRTLKNVGFAKRKMRDLLIEELICIQEKLKEGSVHRLKLVTAPAVINVLWKLLTGQRMCSDIKVQHFSNLLESRARAFDISGGVLSCFPWLRYIMPDATGYNIITSLNNEVKKMIMTIIDEHKQQYVEGAEKDFMDLYLREMMTQKTKGAENSVFTDDNLLIAMFDFFIAGTNDTTLMLDCIFWHVTKHQDVQRKLHKEIDRVIGFSRFPDLEDKPKMPYTEAILSECQRMCFIAPIIGPRRVLVDTTLGGYTIPKNAIVLINILGIHLNPEFYPDPTAFKPERFIKDNVYQSDSNLLTFGKGRRSCPGQALVKSALFLLFVGVMQKYQIFPAPGENLDNLNMTAGLQNSPKPYKVLLVPR